MDFRIGEESGTLIKTATPKSDPVGACYANLGLETCPQIALKKIIGIVYFLLKKQSKM